MANNWILLLYKYDLPVQLVTLHRNLKRSAKKTITNIDVINKHV